MKQIKNLVCSLLLSVCGATMFTACSEDNEAIDAKDLELSKSELVFLAEPGEAQTVTFTANADWKATSEQGWILIDTPVGKKGESTVSVSVKQNPEKVSRQGNVIITEPSTGKMASFKVTQEAEGVNFAVNKETGELAIDNENKVISDRISVVANFDYDIQIKDVDWVTYSIDEATKDIIFYADNEKATAEAKDIVVNFVPEEENVETQSWTLKWNGFTPTVEFYRYKVEGDIQSELIPVTDVVEFVKSEGKTQVSLVVKSNVPWTLLTELDNTIIGEVSNVEQGKNLDRIFTNSLTIFPVFNEQKLDSEDKSATLSFGYENADKKTIDIILLKKGVGDNYIEIDNKAFNKLTADLTGTGWKMFPATAEDGSLSIEIEVRATTPEVHPIIMYYNSVNETYVPVPTNSKVITCKDVSATRTIAQRKTFRLEVEDRSKSMNDDGEARYFKLFMAENADFTKFFDPADGNTFKLKANVMGICESIPFGQAAYVKEYTFESEDVSKVAPPVHNIGADGGVLTINYVSDEPGYLSIYSNVNLIDNDKYIESGELYEVPWASLDFDSYEPGKKFSFKIEKNETGSERSVKVYIGAWLGDGKPEQYFGAFEIKQAAATSTSEQ